MVLEIGSRVGSYEILGALGAGGMGEVYRARDSRLRREVAIKILPQEFAQDPERVARFEREAQVLASLNHPNIGQIYGLEESGDLCALVLELVDGPTLGERLTRGPFHWTEALPIARQIADALEAAHEHGIIHRDLKPANVKLTVDGRVKVLDFGLAKLAAAGASTSIAGSPFDSPTVASTDTQVGIILGTATYMAPEQAQGRTVDKRADIWAFGVLLYEMLSGRPLFGGTSITEVLAAVIKDVPNWTALPDDVPATLRRLIAKCLAKDPKQRLRDIGDARLELDHAAAAGEDRSSRPQRPRTVPLWVLGTAVVGSAVAAAALAIAMRSGSAIPSGAARRAGIEVSGLGDIRAFSFPVTLSPDGSLLVFASLEGASSGSLQVRRFDSLESRPIEGTTGAVSPFVSHDGRQVAFQREGAIFSVPLDGGPIQHAKGSAHLPEGKPAWMRDGRIVYTSPRGELIVMHPDGSSRETLTAPENGERHLSPHPLPDGRTVLFTAVASDANDARIAAVSLADRRLRTLVTGGAVTPQYADGYLLYARPDRRLMAVPFDPVRVEVAGAEQALPDRVGRTRFGVAQFALAPGVLVYMPHAMTRLVEIDRRGQRETLDTTERFWHHPRYSPDGGRIVVDVTSAAGDRDVWLLDRSRTLSRVTRIGDAHDPSWLPDSRSVSFLSFKTNGGPLVIAAADGGTAPVAVSVGPEFTAKDLVNPGGWLPDSTSYLGGVRDHGAPSDIWLIPRNGKSPQRIVGTPADELCPMISRDGKWIAYQSDETGRHEIYARRLDGQGGRVQISNLGGSAPVWDPKDAVVYYVESDGARRRLVAAALRTSPALAIVGRSVVFSDLRMEESDNHANYDIHPDGSRFVMPDVETRGSLVAIFDWVNSFSTSRDR